MNTAIVGHLIAMHGDDAVADCDLLVDVTDFRDDGRAELRFEYKGRSYYLSVDLPGVLAAGMKLRGTES